MTHADKSSKKQTNQQKNSVGIFADIQNVSSIKGKGDLLLEFAQSKGRIDCKNVYYNSHYRNQVSTKNELEILGMKCVDVPDHSENSADYRLMADCVKLFAPKPSPSPNTIILVLGDWDYAGLICMLQALGKKVIIFAQRGSENPRLIKLVGNENFYFVDQLPELVDNSNKTQPQNTAIVSQINCKEAIEYLIEAIKTASSQGKPTVFGRIDKLMRQHCANYQGYLSISTDDGKKFKSFSQFIDVAVKDGKVKKQNQQLFLTELDILAA
ncbi:NYN domain-containing protein [Nostoc edaphicum CCNP1411]|uniref:NYN domain-containing protein n=1 Tax=Nostoc edaphicum CCNP1411 TaxID=1472755 RepID=A0A7D7LGZ9_9NOSO|nr:NYN domain-containing protein [Nostoc edaphicum]QMS88967.1 NYN domain-containing protein [Nostoc edaphicum CCNP1411]